MKRRQLIKRIRDLSVLQIVNNPIRSLFAAIVTDNLYQADKKQDVESRNYLQVNMYGAPTRFGWDHLLKPYDDHQFVPYKFIANKIESQDPQNLADIKLSYSTVKIKGLNMPHQWLQHVPAPHGKTRPMTDLMDNMLMIRGVKLDFSGHPLNAMQQICPIQDGLSLNGVVGDASKTLFASVSIGNNPVTRAFKSERCLLTEIPYEEKNYLEYLLNPFVIKKTDRLYNNAELEQQFDDIASSYPGKVKDIASLKKSSIKNLKDNIDAYLAQYTKLVAKYRELIDTSIATTDILPKISMPKFPYKVAAKQSVGDVLGPLTYGKIFPITDDLAALIKTGQLNYWAEEFALAEFLLVNNLSKSILISPPSPDIGDSLEKINIKQFIRMDDLEIAEDKVKNAFFIDFKKTPGARINVKDKFDPIPMDSHVHGVIYELMATTILYRAMSSCLLEMVDVLKKTKKGKGNLFDETVIHVATEFDRLPQPDGGGTHHNNLANPTSLISGCIKGPQVIGNIFIGKIDEKSIYNGTLGNGAPVKELGTAIKISHVSSTLSHLLRVKPIVGRSPSLVKEENGQVVSLIERPQNVEGVE
ncbi:MAG: hypothetical protein ACXVAX_09930 [Pseudobdellovibrio sp.]